ncbi:hypothetical protein J5S49_13565 [Virgibacillus halodenitrificans]|uniref:hypothetical protein n=1 Tax=Virgibacillus halodenitrificans TaxID=1482 RepID=UPI001F3072EF|nr:hypothetical protein [Virgibacillus halodenitrificans]MCG1029320.1 hypothetical protein [Virgibacillus halodenitrificans]
MARLNAANNAGSKLSASITASDTTLTVEDASSFPAVPFLATLADDEIVKVTAVNGNTFTVERAQEGTTAKDWDAGVSVANRLTAGMYNALVSDEEFTTHKADDTLIKHKAKQIGLEDTSNLFTATELEGAMGELFTNVSNGKSLVGGAITDVDPNVVIPTDPAFQQLADGIGQISTGKKWASGVATSVGGKVKVTGLNFKPSSVTARWENAQASEQGHFSYYMEDQGVSTPISVMIWNPNQGIQPANATMYNDGFEISVGSPTSLDYYWIAFE